MFLCIPDQIGDPLHLCLDAGNQIREWSVGAQHHEPIWEFRDGKAKEAVRIAIPTLVDVLAAAPADFHLSVVSVDSVESRGEDDDVQLMQSPVFSDDAICRDLADGCLAKCNDIDIVLIERLVETVIAEGTSGIESLWGQLAGLFGVCHRFGDL